MARRRTSATARACSSLLAAASAAWPSAVKSLRDSPYLNALNNICNRMYL